MIFYVRSIESLLFFAVWKKVSVDPFYSDANQNYLTKVIEEIDSGKATLEEHDFWRQ